MYRNRMNQNKSRFKVIFGIASALIVLTFIGIIAFWAFVGTVAFKAADEINQNGVKGVIEDVWCGKKGCE